MRAAIAAESVGIPSVSIVCDGFAGQAEATARGMGFDGLPLAVTVGHVDTQSVEEMTNNFVGETVDVIVEGLTSADEPARNANQEPSAIDVVFPGSIDEVNERFAAQGWSDGNPIIPPTKDRVENFLSLIHI